jgi:hypothetical protein
VAKKKKNKSDLRRGPYSGADIERALKTLGGDPRPGGKHINYVVPGVAGRFAIKRGWSGIKVSSFVFNNLCAFLGCSKDELIELLNGVVPERFR